jgi:hypothetical protein
MSSMAQTTQVAEQSMFQKIRGMGFAEIYRRYGTILIFIGIFIAGLGRQPDLPHRRQPHQRAAPGRRRQPARPAASPSSSSSATSTFRSARCWR